MSSPTTPAGRRNFAAWAKGFYRVKRPAIRFKSVYAMAADRWADASTPRRMRFWRFIMDRCITTEFQWRKVPEHKKGRAQ